MAKSDNFLTGYEIEKLYRELKDGESLVISKDSLFRGKVRTEKLTKIPGKVIGKLADKLPGEFDGNGMNEFIRTNWYVNSPEKAFKNNWDKKLTPHIPKESQHPLVIWLEIILDILDSSEFLDNPEEYTGPDYAYNSIGIPKYNITLFFSKKTGTCHFIKSDGKITWIYGREIPEIR